MATAQSDLVVMTRDMSTEQKIEVLDVWIASIDAQIEELESTNPPEDAPPEGKDDFATHRRETVRGLQESRQSFVSRREKLRERLNPDSDEVTS